MSSPPPGFVLDQPEGSQPPEGFVLNQNPPPEGFVLDQPEQPEPRTLSEAVMRQLGLTARWGIEGSMAIPAILANVPASVMNLGLAGADKVAEQFGGNVDYRFPEQNQAISNYLTQIGVPTPETRGEEVVGAISRAMAGGGSIAGTAAKIPGAISTRLASNPSLQIISGGTGAIASETAKELGLGPVGQTVAGVVGGGAPSVIKPAFQGAVRTAFRGGEPGRQQVAETIADFNRVGTTPTVGQATQGRVARATESGLSRTPGASGRIVATAEQQADDVAARLEQRARQLAGKTSAERAGRVIEAKIKGDSGFIAVFQNKQKQLYDALDNWITPTSKVSVANTSNTLRTMTSIIKGAEATSRRLVNPRLKEIADDFAQDAADGNLPFRALKELRTLIGQKLSNVSLVDDVPRAQWKRLYGALSKDLEAAARATNNPKAIQAWTRANNFTRAGHKRIEFIEGVLRRKGGPEKIFAAATSGTKEGATVLRSVMQSLDREGQRIVTATVLRRLGLAKAGVQGELGDRFSTETFLTNWNLLSREAKRTLFDRYGPTFRQDMNAVAKFAANLREGSQVFRNPSGTGQAAAQYTTVGAFVISVMSGNFVTAGAIVAGVTGANRIAAGMTNPNFVRWLARSTKMPAGAIPAQINILAQQARNLGDEDLAWIAALLEEEIQNNQNN